MQNEVAMTRSTALASILLAFAASIAVAQQPVPEAIKVPDGHKLVATFEAKGVQVYEAVKGKASDLEWKFEGPLAELSDGKGKKAGIHYYGPAWEAADGSKVFKPEDKKPTSVKAEKPSDLPWLLVPVTSDDRKAGTLSKVVYIQRVSTRS